MKKFIKKILMMFTIVSCCFFSMFNHSQPVKASSDEIVNNKSYSIDLKDSIVFNIRYDISLSEDGASVGIKQYEYHYYTAIAFNVLTEDVDVINIDNVVYKYKFCKKGMNLIPGVSSTHYCFMKAWSKDKTIYAKDSSDIYELRRTNNLLKPYDRVFKTSINHIGSISSIEDFNIIYDRKHNEVDLSNYNYYFILTEKFTYEDLEIKVNVIDSDGNYVEMDCTGPGCYHDYGTAPTNVEDFLKNTWFFLKDYGPLIILFLIFLLIGIWLNPLMEVIGRGGKMVLQILEYIKITIINAYILFHNGWFWLFTKDKYKRSLKMIPLRKYK